MKVLYFHLFLTISWPLAKGDNVTTTTTSKSVQSQAKTLPPCTETMANSKSILTCTERTHIPKPSETSSDHTLIDVLDLSSKNHIPTIKTGEFFQAGFIIVNKIQLQNCNIRTIESGAFRELGSLVEVHLQNNLIDSLNMQMFENNGRLQNLYLSGNPIHQFIGTQFPKLPVLRNIDLNGTSINKIPSTAFENLENLQEIDLRNNKIRRLDWTTFQYSQKLTKVLLANNEWECDCHMRFLNIFLFEKPIDIGLTIVCKGPEKFANVQLNDIPVQELTCPPQITGLTPIGPGAHQGDDDSDSGHDVMIFSETGKDIGLDCAVDGYPQPEIVWMKDNRPIDDYNKVRSVIMTPDNDGQEDSHYKVIDAADTDTTSRSGTRPDFKHTFTKHLAIYNTSKDDVGIYECVAYHKADSANRVVRSVFLNLTNIQDEGVAVLTGGRGSRTWLWILLALLILLVIALLIVGILIWKKKETRRQLKYRGEMLNKFKGSEIVIDDSFSTSQRKNETSSTVPLLSNNSNNIDNNSIPVNSPTNSSILPDVAQGGRGGNQSLSPVLFSPRPPSSELRKHFFSTSGAQDENATIDRPSRPGSVMSLSYYPQPQSFYPPHRQQLQQGLPYPLHPSQNPQQFYYHNNRPQSYRMAQFAMRRPWGSSQSLVHPDSFRSRPLLMRQFSAGYSSSAAMTRFPPHRESVSSMASEPSWHYRPGTGGGGMPSGYVTLPRNFVHPQQQQQQQQPLGGGRGGDSGFGPSVSPTESTYSTFSYASSTLPPRWNSSAIVYQDSVGPRTTADGGSNLSLNKIGSTTDASIRIDTLGSINLGLMSPTKGKIKPGGGVRSSGNNRSGSSSITPGSLRGRNDFFSFEPIQEVDGGSEIDLGTQLAENEIDQAFSKLQTSSSPHHTNNNSEPIKYRKKKPPPISAIPLRSRKPIRTFEYSKMGGLKKDNNYDFDESLDGDRLDEEDDTQLPSLPTSPPPLPNLPINKPPPPNERKDRVKSGIENIIEKVEGTEV